MSAIDLCTPLNLRNAKPDEEIRFRRAIALSRKEYELFAGLPCDTELAGPGCVHLSLLSPQGMSRQLLTQGLREAYQRRDVVSHEVVVCPISWFPSI